MRNDRVLDSYLSVLGLSARTDGARLLRGQFHDVVLLGDTAYRFPRDEQSRRALPARVALLGAVGQAVTALPSEVIPSPLAEPDLSQPVGRCHVALRRLPGRPLGRDHAHAPSVFAELGGILDALGELGRHPAIGAVAPPADPGYWERFADQVTEVLFPLMSAPGRQRAAAELAAVKTVDPTGDALVHGDLGGANLLWASTDAGPHLTGILDWDEAHIGSQADDLASLAATFGWPFADQLDRHRHGGRCPTVATAHIIEATFALQQALPAALIGDAESLADGLTRYLAE